MTEWRAFGYRWLVGAVGMYPVIGALCGTLCGHLHHGESSFLIMLKHVELRIPRRNPIVVPVPKTFQSQLLISRMSEKGWSFKEVSVDVSLCGTWKPKLGRIVFLGKIVLIIPPPPPPHPGGVGWWGGIRAPPQKGGIRAYVPPGVLVATPPLRPGR